MAEAATSEKDLASAQEARRLAQRAKQAAPALAELNQNAIDRIVDAMADATRPRAEEFARLAVEETGFGVVADKIQKNLFASDRVYQFIRPMKTVGVVNRDEARRIIEIAEPFGVVAGIVPSTNPTSTAIYKILISLKARCPIVISPHPSAARSITRVAEVMAAAAARAGAPDGAINWMQTVSLAGTQELMKHRDVAVILATGGMGLVRAAYSAGKPAYGVGPGNAPCFIERSADLAKAAGDIITGKSFDNGVLCSSPNSAVVESAVAEEVKREFIKQGAYFLSPAEADKLAAVLITPQRLPNAKFVGKSALWIAAQIGITVPDTTRILIAELRGVGRDFPLSIEKLCPVLSYYVVADWREGCERCIQILRYGGMGHTMSVHSQNDDVILQFGLKKPAFRIVVNTPTTHGSIGLTDGTRPGDDARMRRLRRQHHVGQHLAAAPAESQTRRVRDPPGVFGSEHGDASHVGGRARGRSRRRRRDGDAGGPAAQGAGRAQAARPRGLGHAGPSDVLSGRARGRRQGSGRPSGGVRDAGAGQLRLRRGRPRGDCRQCQNRHRRADDRDAVGARPGGKPPGFRDRRMAAFVIADVSKPDVHG